MSKHTSLLPDEETVRMQQFLEEMGREVDQEYEASTETALDTCLECDLFSWNESAYGHAVECRMRSDPLHCGGPYHRVKA